MINIINCEGEIFVVKNKNPLKDEYTQQTEFTDCNTIGRRKRVGSSVSSFQILYGTNSFKIKTIPSALG